MPRTPNTTHCRLTNSLRAFVPPLNLTLDLTCAILTYTARRYCHHTHILLPHLHEHALWRAAVTVRSTKTKAPLFVFELYWAVCSTHTPQYVVYKFLQICSSHTTNFSHTTNRAILVRRNTPATSHTQCYARFYAILLLSRYYPLMGGGSEAHPPPHHRLPPHTKYDATL